MKFSLRTYSAMLLVAGLSATAPTQAALHDRGGGLIYDDVSDVTWQKNANLLNTNPFGRIYGLDYGPDSFGNPTSIIYAGGTADLGGALAWIAAMNAANYLGYSDWRLPSALNLDGSGPCGPSNCVNSEIGQLFYGELGGTAGQPILNSTDPDLSLFENIQSNRYWTSTDWGSNGLQWYFDMNNGIQWGVTKFTGTLSVWAVRSGDVAAVPEPQTYAMLLAGLGLVGMMARRGRRQADRLKDAA